ncbi:MAG: Holliday junction branch migration protein RuvA [Pseudomonadota bacterium]
MIGYLEGKIIKANDEGILLLAGHIGFEVLLPAWVLATVSQAKDDALVSLFIYYHQTERQPRPVLIGFSTEEEKAFFQLFISVDAIGPMKAVKAMEKSVHVIAMAIENKDVDTLASLKGIGKRTAQKIIATLHGKTGRFLDSGFEKGPGTFKPDGTATAIPAMEAVIKQVLDVLVEQLGHAMPVARKMVAEALERNPRVSTPEDLFDEIYRGGDSR